jgi:hypothetical protein
MDNKGNISFIITDKINILAQVDEHISTYVDLATWLRISVPTLNTVVKNHEETERRCILCGPFYMQWVSPKCSPLEKLKSALAAWFKQECCFHKLHPPQGEGLAHRLVLGNNQLFGFQWMD